MKTGNSQIDDSDSEWIVGSDEAGFGSWAGPLVVAAAAVKRGWSDPRIKDSKKYSGERQEKLRMELFREFINTTVGVDPPKRAIVAHVVTVEPEEIDSMGVGPALRYGHRKALQEVCDHIEGSRVIVVDGTHNVGFPDAIYLPKADNLVPACSVASIYAKGAQVLRMWQADTDYPQYGFSKSRGYGTKHHIQALHDHGPCPIHRRSYEPVAQHIDSEPPILDIVEELEQE